MSEFLKKLGSDLYARVVIAKKSTFLGIAVLAGSVIADSLAASPNKIAALAGSLIGIALVAYKGKAEIPAP
jgi:hypothetical protein